MRKIVFIVLMASLGIVGGLPMSGMDKVPGGSGEMESATEPIGEFESDEEDEELSLWQKFSRIRELKRQYSKIKRDSEELERRCEELIEEIASVRKSIDLVRMNARDFSDMLDEQRDAWQRIYTGKAAATPETPEEGLMEIFQNYFQSAGQGYGGSGTPEEELRQALGIDGFSVEKEDSSNRWWERFRIWKENYHKMLRHYRSLQAARQVLERELDAANQLLDQLKESTGKSRNLLREQQLAWGRLYEE